MSRKRILVIDVGGTNVKLACGRQEARFPSGPKMRPQDFVERVRGATGTWIFDVISIGIPAPIVHDRVWRDPQNLGRGWKGFNFEKAFAKPVKIINDAAMQALGSYRGGRMLFLGLGTGVGSALVLDNVLIPLELGELRYGRKRNVEDVLGKKGLKRLGPLRWEKIVHAVCANLKAAFLADYIMLGGGGVKKLRRLPRDTRRGSNKLAIHGGRRLWIPPPDRPESSKHIWQIN